MSKFGGHNSPNNLRHQVAIKTPKKETLRRKQNGQWFIIRVPRPEKSPPANIYREKFSPATSYR